ncbi:fimbrial protein [Porphyromonas levii]|uniref:fimbrial tip adhesin FimD n=1 Tax=Porphyromonas levii TaxID=28114 RepID=UPI001BA5BEEB|nr:fimbrial protein [Porphyromonas levii]
MDPIITHGDEYSLEIPILVRNVSEAEYSPLRASDTGAALRGVGTEPGDLYKDLYDPKVLHENKIDSLNVFIFNAKNNELICAYSDAKIVKSNTDGKYQGAILIPKADAAKIQDKTVKIVAIANANGNIITGVKNLTDLQAKTEQYSDLNKSETARPNFLMDGILEVSDIKWDADHPSFTIAQPMELRRALAKIRFRIGVSDINVKDFQNTGGDAEKATPYDLVMITDKDGNKVPDISVKLVKYTNATSLMAGAPYAPQWQEATEYRPMVKRAYPVTGLGDRAGDFYGAFPFYAGESQWGDEKGVTNPHDETYLMLRIKLRPNTGTTESEDQGTYYYYRIPINYRMAVDGVDKKHLFKVKRNYLYDVITSIEQLGSLDEGEPLEVKSHIALQPWPEEPDGIDGTIVQAHYLVVKEHYPVMANVDTYQIGYISSLPVNIEITEAFYEYYDQRGDYYKVVFDPKTANYKFYWYGLSGGTTLKEMTPTEIATQGLTIPTPTAGADGATVVPSKEYIQNGVITVEHALPLNFVPFQIKFKVTQIGNPNPLSDNVHVTQYPPLFVTGRKSPGFAGGTSEVISGNSTDDYVDFRHYSTLGLPGNYGGGATEAQRNDVFNRITTKVPGKIDLGNGQSLDYSVGNPFDETTQMTVKEDWAQNIVSPEFIIATQHGMTNNDTPQYSESILDFSLKNNHTYDTRYYVTPYGPSSTYFVNKLPYRIPRQYGGTPPTTNGQMYARAYETAGDRCYNYFEGEYGMDGDYGEYYMNRSTNSVEWRVVRKTFKYKGRWRVPTIAEVRLIDAIQDNANSVTKRLMYGRSYWTAKTGTAYGFTTNTVLTGDDVYIDVYDIWGNYLGSEYQRAPVRCIFDTYMHGDDKGM